MWCAPQWITESIKERKLEYNELTELDTNTFRINNHIFKCINCGTGYKIKENINTSCKFHSNTFNSNSGNYNCCERGPNDEKCVTGYHCISAYEYNKIYLYLYLYSQRMYNYTCKMLVNIKCMSLCKLLIESDLR